MPNYIQHFCKVTRSYRRFRGNFALTQELLTRWVNNARITASAGNLQPLRYHLVTDAEERGRVFDTLAWAGYLKDWNGPAEGERPTGYIVMAVDTNVQSVEAARIDVGIAAQTIMLSATEEDFGGCMILAFKKKELIEAVGGMPEGYEPALVLALGRPIEDVRLVDIPENGSIQYWRDENKTHYVPKRALEDILF